MPKEPEAEGRRGLGAGIAAGISDDDPSAIGTFSQIGASFGLGLVWAPILALPIIATAQIAASRIGMATGRGLAANSMRRLPRGIVGLVFLPIIIANAFTIGADMHAMASAAHLVVPAPGWLLLLVLGAAVVTLQIFVPYRRYRRILQVLAGSVVAYLIVLVATDVQWGDVAVAALRPVFEFDRRSVAALIAVLGAAVSPYVIIWQAASEVEEQTFARSDERSARSRRVATIESVAGVIAAMVAAFAIIVATASTLYVNGIRNVGTADQAARALKPLAGSGAKALFAIGIIGTGLLAVPILTSGAALIITELLGRTEGLEQSDRTSPGLALLVTGPLLGGLVLGAVGVEPVRALYYASILNGLATPGLLFTLAFLARSRLVLGDLRIGKGASAVLLMSASVSAALPILYLVA